MRVERLRAVVLGLAVVAGMIPAVLSLAAAPAQAVTCPSVDQTTGAVSPAPSPGVNWSGCDLAGAVMQFASLSGADLAGANLSGTDLSFANLTSADLSGADLANASLLNAHLPVANLSSADFSGASLIGTDLRQANITDALFAAAALNAVSGSEVTGKPGSLPAHWFVASTTDASNATIEYLIGPTANLAGADLNGLNLAGDDLEGIGIGKGSLANTNLTGTDLAGADLNGVQSGGIIGQPSALPANWFLLHGYLLGPNTDAEGANLAGADLTGHDLQGANFDLADLAGADLAGLNLDSVDFILADLSGANLSNTSLTSDLQQANLTDANLTGATITSTNLTSVTWLHTTCPDGSNSDEYVHGCLSALDITPPTASPEVTSGTAGTNGWYTSKVTVTWNWSDNGSVVSAQCPATSTTTGDGDPVTLTASCSDLAGNVAHASYQVKVDSTPPLVLVTGITYGSQYILGGVPAAGCATSDSLSGVATSAAVKISTTGSHGVGPFTATCTGASDKAGNTQAGKVAAPYTVVYGFGRFLSPKPGATLAKSARAIIVTFRFVTSTGQAIGSAVASALAAAGKVRASLGGPAITKKTVTCTWNVTHLYFRCSIGTPSGVKTGSAHKYSITALENVGTGLIKAPAVGTAINPETVHFK